MNTTLHLLLGDKHPREMSPACITRGHMLALHKALLKWLLTRTPPSLWEKGCLMDNVSTTFLADSWLHNTHSIVAAAELPPGRPWHPHKVATLPPITRDNSPPPIRPTKNEMKFVTTPVKNAHRVAYTRGCAEGPAMWGGGCAP